MISIFFVIFLVVFAIAAITILTGFLTMARISGKVFQAVERELDRKASEPASGQAAPGVVETKPKCAHCGTVTTEERCPSCGARMVQAS